MKRTGKIKCELFSINKDDIDVQECYIIDAEKRDELIPSYIAEGEVVDWSEEDDAWLDRGFGVHIPEEFVEEDVSARETWRQTRKTISSTELTDYAKELWNSGVMPLAAFEYGNSAEEGNSWIFVTPEGKFWTVACGGEIAADSLQEAEDWLWEFYVEPELDVPESDVTRQIRANHLKAVGK